MQKILFNTQYGLEQAVLEGRKTMTRRAISHNVLEKYRIYERWYHSGNIFGELKDENEYLTSNLAPYKVGEIVAIAQSYKEVFSTCNTNDSRYDAYRTPYSSGWHNKMFVRADIMHHHIKITGIKVERLQDISDEDCLREGIMEGEFLNTWDRYYFDTWGDVPNHITFKTPREAFASLIDKVGRNGTWQSNPLCFCYSFELID